MKMNIKTKMSSSVMLIFAIYFRLGTLSYSCDPSEVVYDIENGKVVDHCTGLKPMKKGQSDLNEKDAQRIYNVQLNRLGWERINIYRKKHNIPLLKEDAIGKDYKSIMTLNL
jgi:hypothetical protein